MSDNQKINENEFITTSKDIDVTEIMESIKRKIEEKVSAGLVTQREIDDIAEMELLPLPDFQEIPHVYENHLYGDDIEVSPEPLICEDETASGIKGLIKKLLGKTRKIFLPLIRFMTRPIYNDLKQYTVDLHNQLKPAVLKTQHRSILSRDYIKLLHNALNNMIAEFSKLKIEEELLKTKIKVLEDKIEFLENRERAIEKRIFES